MNKVIRPKELRNSKGELFSEIYPKDSSIQWGISYIDFLFMDKSDEEFLAWLNEKMTVEALSMSENFQMDMNIYSPRFDYMKVNKPKLWAGWSIVIDFLLLENGLTKLNSE